MTYYYYYNPETRGLIESTARRSDACLVKLTETEYIAARLVLTKGGYDAIAAAMYKCGIAVPNDKVPSYTIDNCWGIQCGGTYAPLRILRGAYYCESCYKAMTEEKAK